MRLFEPVRIGGVEVRNRIAMPAMHLGYCPGEQVGERIIEFYRERAEGGAGLIVVGGCNIDQHAYVDMPSLRDDSFIAGHRRLARAIQEQGARACAQLFHPGGYASQAVTGVEPMGPSEMVSGLTGERVRGMTVADIEEVIGRFAAAARRAAQAGYDMVEVIASVGYLIPQFFSPVTNRRTDRYGGSFENRARFGREVVRAVREAVGPEVPVLVRLSGHDFVPGGNTNREWAQFAALLEEEGADAFDVTGGWHESRVPQISMAVPPGAFAYLARGVRQAVSVPVIACNRINDVWLAERLLAAGCADLVGMARGLMADPELPRKAREGRVDLVRKCIGCNQGCLDAIFGGRSCTCTVNARVGREAETRLHPAVVVKRVLVVGGGPAGMEAARVAAARGHQVSLWEREEELGGQLPLAASPPDRQDFFDFLDYLSVALFELGVDVETGVEATVERVKDFQPDAVVVATGARPARPSLPGAGLPLVKDAWEVLAGKTEVGQRVVVVGGGATGCEVATFIARLGTADAEAVRFLLVNGAEPPETIRALTLRGGIPVTVVEQEKTAGKGLGRSTRWIVLQDMQRMGGIGKRLPVTAATMWIGALAIAGVPPLAGFFSKDEILWNAFSG
ncbi:MAG: FAD-dependent oxidoreductase, partial [Syntrophomonadaceae bacterium]|nr:FAD-dependent oxidoreductase [Syntrophomonadaceae bacterium]